MPDIAENAESRASTTLGARIRELRRAADLTTEQLAVYSGLNASAVNRLENDRVRRPSHHSLTAIARTLKLNSADELFTGVLVTTTL